MALTHRLTGTRSIGEQVTFTDSVMVFVDYPTSTTWEADILLEPGVAGYVYRVGSGAWRTLWVTDVYSTPQARSAFNVLDRWGQILDTPRLPNETNPEYRTRLLDVFRHRGGPEYDGLVNAIGRDLGLTYNDQALIIQPALNQYTGANFDDIFFSVGSTFVHVMSPDFIVHNEEVVVHPVTGAVQPSKIVAFSLSVTLEDRKDIEYVLDDRENVVYVLDPDLAGQRVFLSYVYEEKVDRSAMTLAELETALEALETPWGDQILEVTVASGYGTNSANNLSRLAGVILAETHLDVAGDEVAGLPIRWTDMKIQSVWDPDLHDALRNWSGSLWGTKIDSAHESLRGLSKMYWGYAVADETIWGTHDLPIHGGHYLDTIYDPPFGFFDDGTVLDKWNTTQDAVYRGVPGTYMQSGVGSDGDLKVVVATEDAIVETGTEGRHIVSEDDEDLVIPDEPVETP